jgi:uncharacterized protein (TIGR02246 family)
MNARDFGRICYTGAACLLLIGATASQVAAQSKPSVEARLQRFEDKEEITQVLLDYGRYLDARDFAGYSSLFAKDGEWVGGFGQVQGPAAIKAFMEKNMVGPNTQKNYHLLSNFVINVNGDTATAWSRWAFVVPSAQGGALISQAGRYDDVFVKEGGRWKFKKRTAGNDTGTRPAAAPAK